MFHITPGAHGPRAFHAVQVPAGVRRRAARRPREPDFHQTVRETVEPAFEGIPSRRADEDPPVGQHLLRFHPGRRAGEGDHHPVTMKLQLIGPAVDPLDLGGGQEFHRFISNSRHPVGETEGPSGAPADEPDILATADMTRSDGGHR